MILSVTSLILIVLANLSTSITNQSTQEQNATHPIGNWIRWLESHSATVTATVTLVGVIVSIIIFVLQQHINHIKELKKSLEQLFF